MIPSLVTSKWLPAFWLLLSGAILWADFVTGPGVALPYLFFIPVALAARYNGRFWGLALAILLPVIRLCFGFVWNDPFSWQDIAFSAGIRVALLVSVALLIDRVTKQARELRVLKGFLPICSVCKNIRGNDQQWHSVEGYIAKHSEAVFSHTVCPDCGERHYGDWIETGKKGAKEPIIPSGSG